MNLAAVLLADATEAAAASSTQSALFLAVALLSLSLWLLLPSGRSISVGTRCFAAVLGLVGLTVIWWRIPRMHLEAQAEFCVLATLTIGCAVATITARSPVYSAIWFAASLLGTSALFLFQGAQFVGVATIAVYAGAIVVTFLFVLMLAQPEGHAFFDRISWGRAPRLIAATTAVCFAIVIAASLFEVDEAEIAAQTRLRDELGGLIAQTEACHLRALTISDSDDYRILRLRVAAPMDLREGINNQASELVRLADQTVPGDQSFRVNIEFVDVLADRHVANLGGRLFSRHLIAIQVTATLLLVALVGAISIAGRDPSDSEPEGSSA